jgi:hypothetical protein
MKLGELIKIKANRVLGIDASTNSVAFCLMENDQPLKWGKIEFAGSDIYDKILDAKNKVYGVVIAELMSTGAKVVTISPTSWQAYIGNKNPTKDEKEGIRAKNPGYADSWYKNQLRNMRKQRTVEYFNNKYNLNLSDFDVADAFGIAHYSNRILTER